MVIEPPNGFGYEVDKPAPVPVDAVSFDVVVIEADSYRNMETYVRAVPIVAVPLLVNSSTKHG